MSLILLLVCCAVWGAEEPGAVVLFDFNKPQQVSVWNPRELAHVESVDSPWDGHGKALKITIDKWSTYHEMWPAAIVSDAGIPDMADTVLFRKLKMKVRNIGDTPAVFFMHFLHSPEKGIQHQEGLKVSPWTPGRTWMLWWTFALVGSGRYILQLRCRRIHSV